MRLPGEEGKVLGICSSDAKHTLSLINNCTPKIEITDEQNNIICTFDFDLDCYTEEMLRAFSNGIEDMKLYAHRKNITISKQDDDGYIDIRSLKQ